MTFATIAYTWQLITTTFKHFSQKYPKIILENSFFFYELDKLTGWISRRNILQKEKNDNFELWSQKILENYFSVLIKAQNITYNSLKPNICSKSNFFAFFARSTLENP